MSGQRHAVTDQLQTLIDTTDWAVIRLYWDFSLKAADISYVPVKDKNGETVISRKTGTAKLEPKFRRRPAKKVYAFDTIAQSEEDSSNNEEILFEHHSPAPSGVGLFSALLQQCVQPLHANASPKKPSWFPPLSTRSPKFLPLAEASVC